MKAYMFHGVKIAFWPRAVFGAQDGVILLNALSWGLRGREGRGGGAHN